jgi:hypothetical protein
MRGPEVDESDSAGWCGEFAVVGRSLGSGAHAGVAVKAMSAPIKWLGPGREEGEAE